CTSQGVGPSDGLPGGLCRWEARSVSWRGSHVRDWARAAAGGEPPKDLAHEPLDAGADTGRLALPVAGDVEHPDALLGDPGRDLRRPRDAPEHDQEWLILQPARVEGGTRAPGVPVAEPAGPIRVPDVGHGAGLEPGLVALDQAELGQPRGGLGRLCR